MADASPAKISGTQQNVIFRYGLKYGGMHIGTSNSGDAVGFFGSLGQIAASGSTNAGDLESSAQQYNFAAFNKIDFPAAISTDFESNKNNSMTDGVTICFYEGKRQAIIAIGGQGQSANAELTIGTGDCSAW